MKDSEYVRVRMLQGYALNRWSGAVPANWWLSKKGKHNNFPSFDRNHWEGCPSYPFEADLVESSHNQTYPYFYGYRNKDFLKVYHISRIDYRKAANHTYWKKQYSGYKGVLVCHRLWGVHKGKHVFGGQITLRDDRYDVMTAIVDEEGKREDVPMSRGKRGDLQRAKKVVEDAFPIYLYRRYKENQSIRKRFKHRVR